MIVEKITKSGRSTAELASVLYEENRMIFLAGEITDGLAAEIVQLILYLSRRGREDITLVINSPGGSVSGGLAIYDAMKGCGCSVATYCQGMAASMGAFLLAAGDKGKRFVSPNSEVMIHQVLGGVQGQATDIQIAAARICAKKKKLNKMLSEMTGQPLERIEHDTDRDYFMDAEEAMRYGIVDQIGIVR